MGTPDLEPDSTLRLPRVTVLKASAGSGKTFRLTQRFVQFLLSEKIPHTGLRNVMAITFSHNASRQMREKVLEWLKRLALKDRDRLEEMTAVTSGGEEQISRRAAERLDTALARFSELQVMTIDSFMASVFRASALDFGFGPDFEVVLDPAPLLEYAWNLFLREARSGSPAAALLDRTLASLLSLATSSGAFPWNPTSGLLAELRRLETRLAAYAQAPAADEEAERLLRAREEQVREEWETVARLVQQSGLEPRQNSKFPGLLDSIRAGRFTDLAAGAAKAGPVKKPARRDAPGLEAWERIEEAWRRAGEAADAWAGAWARSYYQPFVRLHTRLSATLDRVKRAQSRVFIGDLGRTLSGALAQGAVPDVYFRIGERVWHYLVDEFQDTSPLQWNTLFPLVENSLAMNGSLFLVGDTKQAIYGFRQADYRIMRSIETASPFPSAPRDVHALATNWRSRPRLLEFVREVFLSRAATLPAYQEAARLSGLDDWQQEARPGGSSGHVEVHILPRDDEHPPERDLLQRLVKELHARGYGWEDIALLAPRNTDVVRATSWLNDAGVPFLSFSSLDVRTRKAAGEVLALLSFLDSPPDDLSFATFVLGSLFGRVLAARGAPRAEDIRRLLFDSRAERPLYKAFQRAFPDLWKERFASLFRSAGYLPLYDLVSEALIRFDAFSLASEEEATLARLLEVVKDFEGSGAGSLREFLGAAGTGPSPEDAASWSIDVPQGASSVRAMTIHKAKGLGFPVVIVLLYGESRRHVLHGVLSVDGAPVLVKLTKDLAQRDATLQALYEQEAKKADVDALNRLYVALTRAEQEMYVIGVKSDRDTFPFDLLPVADTRAGMDKGPAVSPRRGAPGGAPLSHAATPVRLAPQAGLLGRAERQRGELAHRILELLADAGTDLGGRLSAAAGRAAAEMRCSPEETLDLLPKLGVLLAQADVAECFRQRPGRTMAAEQELCDSA
ncbi:MAG TPA: UvrD-helicase domain-containing protein, partial [Spirochaetia bacterium]|nr:UvrD-helicase domain-containing protein [Spirochaetia bacterium]